MKYNKNNDRGNARFMKRFLSVSIGLAMAAASHSAAASCEYTIQNDWGTGFIAAVTVKNDTSATVNSWNISWKYGNGTKIGNIWSASLSGSDPYTVTNAGFNGTLAPGDSATFGFQATSPAQATIPVLSGSLCGEVTPPPPPPPPKDPSVFKVVDGRITKDGEVLPMKCGSWFGLEGRHEEATDANNPNGAPMELYMGNTFWANGNRGTGRTIQQTMTEIKEQGINTIRLPLSPQTLDANDPQGQPAVFKNHASVRATNARQALEDFIKLADQNDLNVILDIHSCSNYLGWRAGRLDATPPYTDATRDNYNFKRENYSCGTDVGAGVIVQEYNQEKWLANLKELAGFSESLGVSNILGIDIFNEPWDYTWDQWKTLSEKAYEVIHEVNPNILIFVEGIGSVKSDGTLNPHGSSESNPNWGENLFGMKDAPLNIPKDKLVLSPHAYGPSVAVQPQFMDVVNQPECEGLEGDAAGDAKCNVVIKPDLLKAGWEEHFGYLKDQGYAMVVGEFGGHFNWPTEGPIRDQERWKHVTPGMDKVWQNTFVDYLSEKKIEGCYWAINPESDDTGGLFSHAYDPRTNKAGWGEWTGLETEKWDLLKRLWKANQ